MGMLCSSRKLFLTAGRAIHTMVARNVDKNNMHTYGTIGVLIIGK
jgi:hypothetical protein